MVLSYYSYRDSEYIHVFKGSADKLHSKEDSCLLYYWHSNSRGQFSWENFLSDMFMMMLRLACT